MGEVNKKRTDLDWRSGLYAMNAYMGGGLRETKKSVWFSFFFSSHTFFLSKKNP